MTHTRHHLNVAGPFYVEDGCCTRCGVPDVTAPELFGEADYTCFVKRQPETTDEVDRMVRAMITSEVGCIRYGGVDAAESFVSHLGSQPAPERFRTRVVQSSTDRCELAVAWFDDHFHPLTFERSSVPGFQWLIVGLESFVYDWLSDGGLGEAVFFHSHDWYSSRSDGSTVAW